MKRKTMVRLIAAVSSLVIVVALLTACGSSVKGDYAANENINALTDNLTDDMSSESANSSAVNESNIKAQRKIIETIYYHVETKDFDNLVATLESQALSVGGYIESSDVSGNAYASSTLRDATFVFRIPSDKTDEFTNYVSKNSTVTNRSVNTEDVTLDYVDAESRIKALKTEKEALEELLSSATSTTELLEIRDMLTDVIYEIETYESQLRTYDNLIEYTTITIDINEVEQTTVVHKQSTWQRIGTNLMDNFKGIWNFLVELFVFIISSLPYLLFIAVVVFVIVFAIKRARKKKKSKQISAPFPQSQEKPKY